MSSKSRYSRLGGLSRGTVRLGGDHRRRDLLVGTLCSRLAHYKRATTNINKYDLKHAKWTQREYLEEAERTMPLGDAGAAAALTA